MSRSPSKYALQELIGWEEFEKISVSILYGMGFTNIKSAGGVKDGGKDAAVFISDGGKIIIQISQEKDPLKKTKVKTKLKTKFWREYERWTDNSDIKQFVFVSNQELGSDKTTLMEDLTNPPVDIYGIDELINYLDYNETGKEIKKQYAIFDKDLHEVFGADNQNEKLDKVGEVIDRDENYNIHTLLRPPGIRPQIPGTVFSVQEGQVIKYFSPKSYEHYLNAVPTVKVTLSGKREEVEKYVTAMNSGLRTEIPANLVKDFTLKIGDKTFMDGRDKSTKLHVGPVPDDAPRVLILKSVEHPEIMIRSTLLMVDRTADGVILNNYSSNEPLDVEIRVSPTGELKLSYKFQVQRCSDAKSASEYATLFNAVQTERTEVLIDDKGIERELTEIPARGGTALDAGYLRALQDMARIQEFYKVRIPSALADSTSLSKSDHWSIQTLVKIIDDGKADINITKFSLILDRSDYENVKTETAGKKAMAISAENLNILSILGVKNFPNLELILPETTVDVINLENGSVRLNVEALKKSYIRWHQPASMTNEAVWS